MDDLGHVHVFLSSVRNMSDSDLDTERYHISGSLKVLKMWCASSIGVWLAP